MSSIGLYNANRIGERTEPCLTPNMILKKFENALLYYYVINDVISGFAKVVAE